MVAQFSFLSTTFLQQIKRGSTEDLLVVVPDDCLWWVRRIFFVVVLEDLFVVGLEDLFVVGPGECRLGSGQIGHI